MADTWLIVDQPNDDAYWENRFNENLQNPDVWIQQGDELMYSAELLHGKIMDGLIRLSTSPEGKFEELKIFCSFNLLSGYALENYFKGLIIKETLKNRPVELKDIIGHQLFGLASKTSLVLEKTEEELLKRFTSFSIWAGRYPVPKKFKEMKAEENVYGYTIGKHYYKTEDLNTIQGIIGKIKYNI